MRELNGDRPRAGHWILLGAIVALAIAVRVVAIGSQGLSSEESQIILQADWTVGEMVLKPTDQTPFLYYTLHKLFLSPDASLAGMRSISLVFGVLSVGLIYVLGRLAYGPSGGLLAAALLAVWGMHVQYSQEADADALLFFLTLLTSVGLLLYARAVHAGGSWATAGLVMVGAGNVLSFYTDLVSIAWVVLTSLMLLGLAIGRRDRVLEVAGVLAVMALCAIPGIYRLTGEAAFGVGYSWLQQRGLAGFLRLCVEVFLPIGSRDSASAQGFALSGLVRAALVGILAVGLAVCAWLGRQRLQARLRAEPAVLWLIVAYLLVPVLIWLYGFVAQPLLLAKNILYAVPGVILLIAGVCTAPGNRALAWAGCAAVLLYGVSLLAMGPVRERENWRAAYDFLAGAAAAGDVVAICPFHDFASLRFHAGGAVNVPVVTRVDGSTIEIEAALGTDPHWDETLFHAALEPHLSRRWTGEQAEAGALGIAGRIDLRPGQSVWRIDGHCGDKAPDMDRAMSAAGYEPGVVRYQDDTGSPATILIRQYRVNAPITLEIRDATPKP
jgi:hypothetical protein